jgi:prephenate dehydrogenase
VKTVCIAGVGLIGGSFALALRKAGFTGRIIGASSPQTIAKALALGVIDDGLPLAEAAAQVDCVYLAQPIQGILDTIREIDAWVRPGTLITDAGSTKGAIVVLANEKIRRGRFVGGHPMAGKETRGVEGAAADLFVDRPYVLTSPDTEIEEWIGKIGARLVRLSAEEHDALVARSSHVPQLASTALAALIDEHAAQVAGPGALDMTRLALSSYEIWRDILATNPEAIDKALGAYIAKLEEIRRDLRNSALKSHFESGAHGAERLRKR